MHPTVTDVMIELFLSRCCVSVQTAAARKTAVTSASSVADKCRSLSRVSAAHTRASRGSEELVAGAGLKRCFSAPLLRSSAHVVLFCLHLSVSLSPTTDATYALKVGELSGVVDTDSGVHIILRTA
jgi:NIMA-interacting peptidyl-prolyl cis-trans isomerase 1